jgi:hypothetical protein
MTVRGSYRRRREHLDYSIMKEKPLLTMDIDMDYVMIEGQTICRPTRISRCDWLDFWNNAEFGI